MLLQTLILATAIQFSICGWKEDIRALHYDKPLCSIAKSLYKEKPYEFKLNKRKDLECEYTFLGSISRNCTAEISCNQLDLPPQNSNGVCDNGHIQIGDSFGSQITGCGKLEFGGPYRPSRNGRYLYVRVKGNSAGTSICVGSPIILWHAKWPYILEFKQLKTYPRYSGRRVTEQCVCGHKFGPSGRIINGQDVVPFEFPWAAAIVGSGSSENLCGGSIINNRYILTAAHCLIHRPNDPSAFQVLLHAHVLDLSIDIAHLHETNESYFKEVRGYLLPNTTDESENRIRLNVSKILIYPNFFRDGETPSNDIALLRLSRSLKLYNNENQRVGTICLPQVGELKDYTERMMTAIGWGKPAENSISQNRLLQKVDIPILPQPLCREKLKHQFLNVELDPWSEAMFCAGFSDGSKDTCSGDSGSSTFIADENDQYTQIGIVSFGLQCASPRHPGVYTKIDELVEWIHKETHDAIWCEEQIPTFIRLTM